MRMPWPERGIAVMSALGVSAVLALLAVVCLSLAAWKNAAAAHELQALQADWNARAGLERYLATGQLPQPDAQETMEWTLAEGQRCRVLREADGTLTFEGLSGKVSRKLTCLQGDPARLREDF